LHVGDSAFIADDGGDNSIRSTPDTSDPYNGVTTAKEGEVLEIIGGPVCDEYGYLMWEVRTTRDETGWTPETKGDAFWILPLTTREICEGALPTRLVAGKRAKVMEVPPDPNLIRSDHSRFDTVIGKIQPGAWMKVLEGPFCGNKVNWWKVEAESTGIVGWVLEGDLDIYYLAPEP
jgi:hypothetical protein